MAHEIETSTVEVGDLGAYLARPVDGGTAGMLVLPMITGIGTRVREFAADIAAAGVTALTWDPWHGPSIEDTPREELAEKLSKLDDEEVLGELRQLLDHLFGELGMTKVGVIGWCLGGRFALLAAARDQRLANVVAYHPTVPLPPKPNHTLDTFDLTRQITAPVMMLYPAEDAIVSHESFVRLRDAMESRERGASIVHLYPGAEHGFTDSSKHGTESNAEAYAVSWPQALAFITATTS